MNPFCETAAYQAIAHLPLPLRLEAMRDEGFRGLAVAGVPAADKKNPLCSIDIAT